MEFLLGLITGYLLNWMALSALVLLAVFFEALECTTTALLVTAAAAFVAYLFFQVFQVPPLHIAYGAGAYALIGVAWSIWRYRRFVHEKAAEAFSESDLRALAPGRNAGRIVHWMVVWPISMASNLIGDVLVLAKSIVTKWLRSIYEGIYQGAVATAKKDAA